MGIQLRYFVCIAIGLSISGRHANSEEPAKAPIKKLILPGEAFLVEGRPAFVFLPPEKERRQPQPWILYAPTLPPYPDTHEKWMHEQFLAAGVAVAGIDVGESYGSPQGRELFTALYQKLTKTRGFASKPCLLGRSRGGLWVTSWACDHADQVAGIAGIYPVFDLRTYPGLAKAAPAYGLTADELGAKLGENNPIERVGKLAKAKVPIFIIHGDEDKVVPLKENSAELAARYEVAGARDAVTLVVAKGQGHNFWEGSLFGSAANIGRQIKQRIRSELKLIASVGVAPNKFVAKIASDLNKPDGFLVVEPDEVQSFLDPLPVGRLWGVGKVTGEVFDRLSIRTIGQLRQLTIELLNELFGSTGEHFWQLAHGLDARPVVPDREAKSISHETTFAEDIADPEVLRAWLTELAEQVARRLRRHALKGRTVELKVRFADFQTITRSLTLAEPTNITQELLQAGTELLATKLPQHHLPVRLLGFGVQGLDDRGRSQRQLFGEPERERHRQLDRVADQISEKFGRLAIRRGGGADQND